MIREDFHFRTVYRNAIKRFYKQMNYEITDDDIFIVWQCKTLQNWKAMASTYISDGRYFEITYNGDKNELYLDAYRKEHNECIKLGVEYGRDN